MSMGLMHAAGTADVIRDHLDDPVALAAEHDRMSEDRVLPWYRQTVELDRARKREMDASIAGGPAEPGAALPGHDGGDTPGWADIQVGMLYDAEVFRAFLDVVSLQALPGEIMARPGFSEQLAKSVADREAFVMPGPSRADLLRSLA
jgi:hypothetical protein